MQKVIISGAGGFVGQKLCERLVNEGVRCYGIFRNDEKYDCNVQGVIPIFCDLNNPVDYISDRITEHGFDVFFHLAWGGVTGNARGAYELQIDNIRIGMSAIEAAAKLGCRKFIGVGSIAELDAYNAGYADDIAPNMVSMYGTSKMAFHMMGKALANKLGVEFVWVQLGNAYGEGDNSTNFVNFAVDLIRSDKEAAFTSGEQNYDFVHIRDVIEGLYCIGKNGIANRMYYVGSGSPQKLKYYILKIRDTFNPQKKLYLGKVPYNGISASYADFDCTKTMKDTGYRPAISFEKGLEMMQSIRRVI